MKIQNKEHFLQVLKELEEKGFTWASGNKPLEGGEDYIIFNCIPSEIVLENNLIYHK